MNVRAVKESGSIKMNCDKCGYNGALLEDQLKRLAKKVKEHAKREKANDPGLPKVRAKK